MKASESIWLVVLAVAVAVDGEQQRIIYPDLPSTIYTDRYGPPIDNSYKDSGQPMLQPAPVYRYRPGYIQDQYSGQGYQHAPARGSYYDQGTGGRPSYGPSRHVSNFASEERGSDALNYPGSQSPRNSPSNQQSPTVSSGGYQPEGGTNYDQSTRGRQPSVYVQSSTVPTYAQGDYHPRRVDVTTSRGSQGQPTPFSPGSGQYQPEEGTYYDRGTGGRQPSRTPSDSSVNNPASTSSGGYQSGRDSGYRGSQGSVGSRPAGSSPLTSTGFARREEDFPALGTPPGGRRQQQGRRPVQVAPVSDVYFPNRPEKTYAEVAGTRSSQTSPRPQPEDGVGRVKEAVVPASVDLKKQVEVATTQFSLEAFKKLLHKTPGNVVVSPMSVQALLAMLQQGAVERSAEQLERVLGMSPETSRAGYSAILKDHLKHSRVLAFANKLFVSRALSPKAAFQKILRDDFNSGVQKLSASPLESVEAINTWVRENTNGRIDNLVKSGDISAATRLVLANAIHFKAKWLKTFSPEETVKGEFHPTPDGAPVDTNFMFQLDTFHGDVNEDIGARWLELLYNNRNFSMLVVLPTEGHTLDDVVQRLTPQTFKMIARPKRTYEVRLLMPRFKIEADSNFKELLIEMGLTDVFGSQARLEGVATSSPPLYVSDVVHKALMHVTEEGTHAAGASYLVSNALTLQPVFEKIDFNMTQPFLAIVMDLGNNVPLFMARVSNPGLIEGEKVEPVTYRGLGNWRRAV